MAADLQVPAARMQEAYRHSFDERARGQFGSLRSTLDVLARRLNARPTTSQLHAATERRLELNRSLHDRSWAIPTLRQLQSGGIGVAVVTDTTAETVEVWNDSPLKPVVDAVSFSCQTGIRKPSAEAYLIATEKLGVAPSQCLYIGDGSSQEISGAQSLGMKTLKFIPTHNVGDAVPAHAKVTWDGVSFSKFSEIPYLLGRRVINITDAVTDTESTESLRSAKSLRSTRYR